MTLPASGNIQLTQIQDEFLAPRGTSLTSFYRGGAYVANTGSTAPIPTSGSINMQQFYGTARTGPLAVGASDVSGNSWPGSNVTFGSSFANPSGGTPPYTYAWTFVSGTTFTINNPTSQGTGFTRTANPPQNSPVSGVYRITVTDALSATAFKNINVADSRA